MLGTPSQAALLSESSGLDRTSQPLHQGTRPPQLLSGSWAGQSGAEQGRAGQGPTRAAEDSPGI